ncbi:hypothetical protein J6590_101034, partial [Homalodisca vitripennis]
KGSLNDNNCNGLTASASHTTIHCRQCQQYQQMDDNWSCCFPLSLRYQLTEQCGVVW